MAKILIVEDDPVIRSAYVEVFQDEGHDVSAAEDGMKALQTAESVNPDLILLDILLPKMSGTDFLHAYRAKAKNPAEVVIISNVAPVDEKAEAQKLGVKHYLTKSAYSMKQLVGVVNELLEHHGE